MNNLLPIYTNIKIHNARARGDEHVLKFRKELLKQEIKRQNIEKVELEAKFDELYNELKLVIDSKIKFDAIEEFLIRSQERLKINLDMKHQKKLHQMYNGQVPLIQTKNNVINLSSIKIDKEIEEILQLGLNCHLKTKYNHNDKLIEIEKLYESINNHEKNNKIVIDNKDNLKTELKCFGIKKNVDYSKNVLTKKELFKLKSFMINNNISIYVRYRWRFCKHSELSYSC